MFKNRHEAAKQLLPLLLRYKAEQGIVLAIPRGGIPLGRIIADELSWPLEPLLIKKIGHPENEEFAIGAVSLETIQVDPQFAKEFEKYIREEAARLRSVLLERNKRFMEGKKPADVKGKTVIVVDDGVATGRTMMAGISLLRQKNPARIIVAVPVTSNSAADRISSVADELVYLDRPEEFFGVGQFYEEFPQVDDSEVKQLLHQD
jgi:putative phosphoribosyl transferase